jgi:hypothetical protein
MLSDLGRRKACVRSRSRHPSANALSSDRTFQILSDFVEVKAAQDAAAVEM